jgi:hypothetical protein
MNWTEQTLIRFESSGIPGICLLNYTLIHFFSHARSSREPFFRLGFTQIFCSNFLFDNDCQ